MVSYFHLLTDTPLVKNSLQLQTCRVLCQELMHVNKMFFWRTEGLTNLLQDWFTTVKHQ